MDQEKQDPNEAAVQERSPAASSIGLKLQLNMDFIRNTPYQRSPAHESDGDQLSSEVKIDTGMLHRVAKRIHNVSPSNPNPECSIYIAPSDIRDFDPKAYTPKVVSIGPYHCKNPSGRDETTADPYKEMQDYKWRCLRTFISRHWPDRTDTLVNQCLVTMKKNEGRIMSYYSHRFSPDDELPLMMLLDGCFILYLLLEHKLSLQPEDKHVPGRIWIWTLVKYDLLLLENQIPFFVVTKLYDILRTEKDRKVNLVQRALHLFKDIQPPKNKNFSATPDKVHHHLLHLFYSSLLPDDDADDDEDDDDNNSDSDSDSESSLREPPKPIWIPSATELVTKSDLKFGKKHEANSFLDVAFSRKGITRRGVMEIPPIRIDDHSKDLFRNLIAFEQCYPHTKCHVTVYSYFMDCIMNTESDVRLLHFEEILINRMSADQEITHFFSQLCRGIHVAEDRFYLGNLFKEVIDYQVDKCNKCWADFKLTYCGNSWAVFAGVVSVIFFVLAIAQTIYTIYPYYNPRN